ncbi:hypothetical protein AB0C01_22810 [Micromonospora sp. NPDC048905]|uniref:hypothetical protein n=1 Tax=unclassified Micromonospora TaxID=2617518 RepID=UPI0033F4F0B0
MNGPLHTGKIKNELAPQGVDEVPAAENTAADAVRLTADQLKRLDSLTPAGARHDEANMASIDR